MCVLIIIILINKIKIPNYVCMHTRIQNSLILSLFLLLKKKKLDKAHSISFIQNPYYTMALNVNNIYISNNTYNFFWTFLLCAYVLSIIISYTIASGPDFLQPILREQIPIISRSLRGRRKTVILARKTLPTSFQQEAPVQIRSAFQSAIALFSL